MKLPTEMEVWHGDLAILVRFDYDRGESQWFDARAGVGSPGHDPCVDITECNVGSGWCLPHQLQESFDGLDFNKLEQQVMDRLIELEADEQAARDEAEYAAWNEHPEWGAP